jgi:hypothetical protein
MAADVNPVSNVSFRDLVPAPEAFNLCNLWLCLGAKPEPPEGREPVEFHESIYVRGPGRLQSRLAGSGGGEF